MHLPHFKKTFVAAGLAAGLALGAGGIAVAWFTASGYVFGGSHVANAQPFTVTQTTFGNPVGPGGTTTLLTFNVHNNANFNEHFTRIDFWVTRTVLVTTTTYTTAPIRTYNTGATSTFTRPLVTGCPGVWFTLQFDTAGTLYPSTPSIGTTISHPTTIPANGTVTLTFVLGMVTANTTQLACAGHQPEVYVNVKK